MDDNFINEFRENLMKNAEYLSEQGLSSPEFINAIENILTMNKDEIMQLLTILGVG